MRRPQPFFRGSELPRLLVLLLIAAACWVVVFRRPPSRPAPGPPPPPTVASIPLCPLDGSPPFRGIQDRTFLSARDTAAYAELIRRVRETPYQDLAARSRREIVFSQLIENPVRYRGLPIHVEGTALRVLMQHVEGSKVYPDGRYYEAYVITSDSQNYPLILSFEDAPPELEVGDNVRQRVAFDDYFFKLLAYKAGDEKFHIAPLLVGRFPPAAQPAAPAVVAKAPARPSPWPAIMLGVVTVYVLARMAFYLWKTTAPARRIVRRSAVNDRIEPEDLAAWVEGRREEDTEPPEDDADEDDPDGRPVRPL